MLQKPFIPSSGLPSSGAPLPRAQAGEMEAGALVVAAILVLAVAFGLLFRHSVVGAVSVWYGSRTYNHCFLVLPVIFYLVYDRRAELMRLTPRPRFWPLLLLVPLSLVWLFGYFAGVLEVQQLAFVAMFEVGLFAILGWPIYRLLLFPLLYLFFLVPSGEFLVPSMQDFTASFVVHGLQFLGIPVYSNGVFITIPNGRFEVAEACAGLRFLIASIAFGFLYAYFVYRTWGRRLFFIALSLAVPLIANGFRALGIVLLAHYSNNRIAVGFDHIVYGWIFFSLVTLTLIWLGYLMREGEEPIGVPPPTIVTLAPRPLRRWRIVAVAAAILAVVCVPRAFAAWRDATVPKIDAAALVAPRAQSPWQPLASVDPWRPQFPAASVSLRRDYLDAASGRHAYLYIAFYAKQSYGAKVVSTANRFDDDKLWKRADVGHGKGLVAGRVMPLGMQKLQGPDGKREVYYWYWVDGRFTASRLMAKLLEVQAEFLGRKRSAAAIAVAADYDVDPAVAVETLHGFLAALPSLAPMLEQVAAPAASGIETGKAKG